MAHVGIVFRGLYVRVSRSRGSHLGVFFHKQAVTGVSGLGFLALTQRQEARAIANLDSLSPLYKHSVTCSELLPSSLRLYTTIPGYSYISKGSISCHVHLPLVAPLVQLDKPYVCISYILPTVFMWAPKPEALTLTYPYIVPVPL